MSAESPNSISSDMMPAKNKKDLRKLSRLKNLSWSTIANSAETWKKKKIIYAVAVGTEYLSINAGMGSKLIILLRKVIKKVFVKISPAIDIKPSEKAIMWFILINLFIFCSFEFLSLLLFIKIKYFFYRFIKKISNF